MLKRQPPAIEKVKSLKRLTKTNKNNSKKKKLIDTDTRAHAPLSARTDSNLLQVPIQVQA